MTLNGAADALLSGPRGRRLCWELIDCDLAALAAATEELALIPALEGSTGSAMYWQEPDDRDMELAGPAVQETLRPVALAVMQAPAAQWWAAGLAPGSQQSVERPGTGPQPAHLTDASRKLATWRAETLRDEESAASLPEDPAASYSGHWWSTPVFSGLPATTRAIPGLGAVGLALVEDSLGWDEVRCRPVRSRPGARVCEISGPEPWADLVASYPLEVTRARRHDWWRVSGWSGRWLIPDYAAVAADYDAVHLSVAGYLSTAGRALPVGGGACTMLAGWDPDQTYWLADVLSYSGPATNWALDQDRPADQWRQVLGATFAAG